MRTKFKNTVLKSRFFVDFVQADGIILEEWELFAESISDLKIQIDEILERLKEQLTTPSKAEIRKNLGILKKDADEKKGFQYINYLIVPYLVSDKKVQTSRWILSRFDDYIENEIDVDLTYTPRDPLDMSFIKEFITNFNDEKEE